MAGERGIAGSTRRVFLSGLLASGALALVPGLARAVEVARVGTRSIHVLSDGGFTLPLSMLARGVPPDELIALLAAEGLPTDEIRSVLNVTLIRDGESWTIIDCGAGANFLPGSGQLAANLEAAGIDRAKVARVLFTHAHPDHLWGAIDEFDSDLFPNARYQISEREFAFWTAADVYSRLPEDRHSFAAGAQRILKVIDEKLERFTPGSEVAPGILAVDTAGHTPGHVSFEIGGEGASLLVIGDALTHPIISFRYPDWRTVSDTDPDHGVATRWRLLDQLATRRIPIIGYHLPMPGLGRVERAGSAFRFVAG
jgi:glyoxylase-like metal-dependent hydrolase (beta-lactamase superfamily II)